MIVLSKIFAIRDSVARFSLVAEGADVQGAATVVCRELMFRFSVREAT